MKIIVTINFGKNSNNFLIPMNKIILYNVTQNCGLRNIKKVPIYSYICNIYIPHDYFVVNMYIYLL